MGCKEAAKGFQMGLRAGQQFSSLRFLFRGKENNEGNTKGRKSNNLQLLQANRQADSRQQKEAKENKGKIL